MKKRVLSIIIAAVVSVGAFSAPVQELAGSSSVAMAASDVSAPSASRRGGTYAVNGSLSVKLTAASGAKIYYSTGSSYKLYSKALKLTKNTTLKCYAVLGGVKSSVKTYKYKLTPKVTFSEDEGAYDAPVTVKLTCKTSGVKLYYTLDGSKPTTSSKLYSTGIDIARSSTLRVLASKSGWTNKYFSYEYDIINATDMSSESILDDYTNKYAYSTLTSTQQKIYAKLFEAAAAHADKADLTGIGAVKSDIDKTYWAFDYDNPQFFWLANGYRYTTMGSKVISIKMVYSRSRSEAAQIQPKFDAAAQKIIDEALAQDDLFDRVKVLHDAVVDLTDYTRSGSSYISEADGPLVYGKALCEGYSKAFMYLCQAVGIECICVAGTGNGEPHMWNMIKLDGDWYNMDVTWDDTAGYDYFCIPTSQITLDHQFDNTFPVPQATATDYSYTSAMDIQVNDTVNSAYSWLVENAAANWKNGVYTTTVYFKSGLENSLIAKLNKQDFFDDLSAYGCDANGWSGSYTDRSLTLTLS